MNIYQHSKFIQSVISTPKKWKIYTSSWNSFGINLGGWMGGYYIQITNFCRITTCNERQINRVHLKCSLYTNCQNRPCGKEFNTTAFVNLHNYNVYAVMLGNNRLTWRGEGGYGFLYWSEFFFLNSWTHFFFQLRSN